MSHLVEHPTVWIPMADGTRLAARIWRPAAADTAPVGAVLEFLPYRRRDVTAARDASVYPAFAAMGLAGVRVDLRGTGDSEGFFDDEYSPTELADAEATIAWIAAQPWCNGKVGMMGISWGGFNALQVAARRPPALKAVISIASTVDRFADDIHYKGGAQMSANLYWATQMLCRAALPPDSAVVGDGWQAQWQDRLRNLPALIFPWLKHQRRDAYWRHGSISEDFRAVQAPALVIAGWADGYRNTPWKARAGLGQGARALTGPWVHLYPHFAVPEPRLDFVAEAGRWWGRWLQDRGTGAEDLPAHRLFLSEAVRPDALRLTEPGQWIAVAQGPETTTELTLAPGTLSAETDPLTTTADLRSPLDCGTDGGEFFTQGSDTDLPGDQRADDGLSMCFETGVLDQPLDIIGMPELTLPVALDQPQGTLVGRLLDVHPDGVSHRISLAVLNLSHRNGSAAPHPMVPGRAEDITLRFDAAAYRLRPGHRLRLALSTAYFPMILNPPKDVTATLTLGPKARLRLPSAPFDPVDLPDAGSGDPRPAFPRHSPAHDSRRVTRDRGAGTTTVTIEGDSGLLEEPGHGMRFRALRRSDWSITRGDPLSLQGDEMCRGQNIRDGVETDVIATGCLRATETHWLVEARIEARIGGETIHTQSWREAIARDHM